MAKFWRTAIVALLLCTTSVMTVPVSTPSTGISDTLSKSSVNTGLFASGCITLPIVSMPRKSSPKAKMVRPIFFILSDLERKEIRNPTKMIRKI